MMEKSEVSLVGSHVRVRASVRLGPIPPDEVSVELYLGRIDARGDIADGLALPMEPDGRVDEGSVYFELAGMPCSSSGMHGYTVRVTPYHVDLPANFPARPDRLGRRRSEVHIGIEDPAGAAMRLYSSLGKGEFMAVTLSRRQVLAAAPALWAPAGRGPQRTTAYRLHRLRRPWARAKCAWWPNIRRRGSSPSPT